MKYQKGVARVWVLVAIVLALAILGSGVYFVTQQAAPQSISENNLNDSQKLPATNQATTSTPIPTPHTTPGATPSIKVTTWHSNAPATITVSYSDLPKRTGALALCSDNGGCTDWVEQFIPSSPSGTYVMSEGDKGLSAGKYKIVVIGSGFSDHIVASNVFTVQSHQFSSESNGTVTGWRTYTNNQYGFQIQYPADFLAVENDDNSDIVAFYAPRSEDPDSINDPYKRVMVAKAYIQENKFPNFDAYKEDMKNNLVRNLFKENNSDTSETELDAQVLQQAGHYSFQEETINGVPVIFHKREFLSMMGGVYQMHVGISGNKILLFNSEYNPELLTTLYHSFKLLK